MQNIHFSNQKTKTWQTNRYGGTNIRGKKESRVGEFRFQVK